MGKIIITESQLKKLFETAMDLDHYTRDMEFSDGAENRNVEDSTNEILDKLKELVYMFKTGKKIESPQKFKIFKALDNLNAVHSEIKSKP
jgi:hypothetical protein